MSKNNQITRDHNPVPFDFVPFSPETPALKTREEWENEGKIKGELFSGVIEYDVETLTPLHIVGKKDEHDKKIERSFFFTLGNRQVIPGYSVKGMIRSFAEAVTNGWIGQVTEIHAKPDEKITYGFTGFSDPDGEKTLFGPVIPEKFRPDLKDNTMDLASFMFGSVMEELKISFASRVKFEDLTIPENIELGETRLPDVPGDAFMGGPKPRINNWWYFSPKSIIRNQRYGNAEFMGEIFRGWKFYYHQDCDNALKFYADYNKWPQKLFNKKYGWRDCPTYQVQTIPAGQTITGGRVDFERLPRLILDLLLWCLSPSGSIAHKLGYGKAFGLGSVAIRVTGGTATKEQPGGILDEPVSLIPIKDQPVSLDQLKKYIDSNALKYLERILNKQLINEKIILTYPLFVEVNGKTDFKKPVKWRDAVNAASDIGIHATNDEISVNESQAKKIAEKLWDKKTAIHFELYQEKAKTWQRILKLSR